VAETAKPEGTGTAGEDARGDFGFGSRVAQHSERRLLNRDGSFNVVREGLPFHRSLSLYHALLTMSWPRFFLLITGGYFAANLFFAVCYYLCGPHALDGWHTGTSFARFEDAFFFSVQTLATIGYGRMTPNGTLVNLVVTVEALVGLLGFAQATGLLFARVSRPTARLVFSRQAVVAPFRGGTALMFRIANLRSSQLSEVTATVSLSRLQETPAGRVRRFAELALDRAKVLFLPLHWVVVHPIDERSPLFGMSEEAFRSSEAEILILITGSDETFAQIVHTRSSYRADEVVWGARFADMFLRGDHGQLGVDMRKIHDIEPV